MSFELDIGFCFGVVCTTSCTMFYSISSPFTLYVMPSVYLCVCTFMLCVREDRMMCANTVVCVFVLNVKGRRKQLAGDKQTQKKRCLAAYTDQFDCAFTWNIIIIFVAFISCGNWFKFLWPWNISNIEFSIWLNSTNS